MNLPTGTPTELSDPYGRSDPLRDGLPWWSLEAEIDLLRRRLASLPMGATGIFIAALHNAAAASASSAEVSVADFAARAAEYRVADSVCDIERAICGVLLAEGVLSSDRDEGTEHRIPADMILSEEERIVLTSAGAEAGLLYRPEAGIHERIFVRVSAVCPMGIDLTSVEP